MTKQSKIICSKCKEDMPKRMVIRKHPFEEVSVSEKLRKKYGLIREIICKNEIKIRIGTKDFIQWISSVCDTHILRVVK